MYVELGGISVSVGGGVSVSDDVGRGVSVGVSAVAVSIAVKVAIGVDKVALAEGVIVEEGVVVKSGVLVATLGTYNFCPTLICVPPPMQFASCSSAVLTRYFKPVLNKLSPASTM